MVSLLLEKLLKRLIFFWLTVSTSNRGVICERISLSLLAYRQSCRVLYSTEAVCHKSPQRDEKQTHQSWSSQASQGQEQLTILLCQTAHLYLKVPRMQIQTNTDKQTCSHTYCTTIISILNFSLLFQVKAHQCVCVHENTFGVMCEGPAVEFGEGDTQVGPLHHNQVCRVAAVQHVHHPHLIKDPLQHRPNGS